MLGSTAAHAPALNKYVTDIRNFLPSISAPQSLHRLLGEQEDIASSMAAHLESLAMHFEQTSRALRDQESGHPLSSRDAEGGLYFPAVHSHVPNSNDSSSVS